MKLAMDAMGGDNAPEAIVEAAMKGIQTHSDLEIILVGNEEHITKYLKDETRISILHTDEKIEDTDSPTAAVRRKKNASMVLAIKEVKEGRADAVISAGNTGALMTAGLLHIGRINGIERPALAPMLKTTAGEGFLLLDVGANMDAKEGHLLQYAIMGNIYMQTVQKMNKPRVGLLNVGTEEGKGNELTKKAFELLKETDFQFIGNIESRDLLNGAADVVVCDGFSGNLVLKSAEGTAATVMSMLKKELTSSLLNKLAASILKPSFKRLKKQMSYSEYGGASLFGLKAPVIKAHGSSDAVALAHAIRQANEMVSEQVVTTIKNEVAKYQKMTGNIEDKGE
ncbi:phosphate acyltransferase PlsX [Bacillus sp. FJAT-45350]|uniref:phosphate acyltransferase PlsX n=1 Tax=Bacillus sp. FJAT-45350 TaxID=2011014 RepID=UPI000BB7F196|nr:phosphate acyltransferase PlsX [Bacillus sp. FJAT-45350]